MGRTCTACNTQQPCSRFTYSQWCKGNGKSRCKDCVENEVNKDVVRIPPPHKVVRKKCGGDENHVHVEDKADSKDISPVIRITSPSSNHAPVIHEYSETRIRALPFHNFFEEDSIGFSLFTVPGGIRSYLTVNDLLACAKTGHGMHRMCRTYTVHEMLEKKSRCLDKDKRKQLGLKVMKSVISHHDGPFLSRPVRVIIDSPTNAFWAKLYHPDEMPQADKLIDKWLDEFGTPKNNLPCGRQPIKTRPNSLRTNHKTNSPVLVSAFFCQKSQPAYFNLSSNAAFPKVDLSKRIDVTRQVNELIQENVLRLSQPPRLINGKGERVRQPSTFTWWYTRLFGDPFPHCTKILEITTHDPRTRKQTTHHFEENSFVCIPLARM